MFKQSRRKNNSPLSGNGGLFESNNGFYNEDSFLAMISLERRRAERTRRAFMLMLIDISGIEAEESMDNILSDIYTVIQRNTRETDMKGWFESPSVIGVIFIEINESDKDEQCERIRNELRKTLSPEHFDGIKISCFVFPEEIINGKHKDQELYTKLYPDLARKRPSKSISHLFKRIIDLAGGIAGLAVFAPLFIIIPILIKLTSKGPVFFRQERVGLLGRKFTFLKFRSMHTGNDHRVHKKYIENFIKSDVGKDGVYKIKDDPRVTHLGRVLRKSSLDEIPQLINVIKGEMSLVGPRPPISYEVDHYDIWHRRRILETKPGITGLWQVRGRSSTSFDEMVRLDLKYIREWSLWLDTKILLRTPWAVINCRGAY